jgi:ribosomal protein S18 acetylase RimI-like enzyme
MTAGSASPVLIVREVRPSDFNDLVECYYSYYDEYDENPTLGLPRPASKPSINVELDWFSNLCRRVSEGNAVATVAEFDSHAVGLCEVTRVLGSPEVSHRGDLGIAIRKEYRGRGIGTALLERTIQECKGRFEAIELMVFSNNDKAKRLYEKFGFKPIGVRPRAIKRGEGYLDEDLMILFL